MTTDTRPGAAPVQHNAEVQSALADGRPIVVMESTIYSQLGLPQPFSLEAFERCEAAIRAEGGVPALSVVLDGTCWVGAPDGAMDRIASLDNKLSARDLGVCVARRQSGVTTVAASLQLAALSGIAVFTTGGIGGVHRGSELTGDVSADLWALRRFPVSTVTAGAKAFLDLPRTVEFLDTIGVPVLGVGTDSFPAFYTRASDARVACRVESAAEAAAIVDSSRTLGYDGGFVLANPIPEADELDPLAIDEAIEEALGRVSADRGAEVTPAVLAAIAEATEGRSIPANLALAENNARFAARLARELATT